MESAPAYRSTKEMDECKKRDPIPRFRSYLTETEGIPIQVLKEIDEEVEELIEEAVRYAQDSPSPNPESATEDLFA